MSGSTIGGVIGAAVGFYVGGPQGAQYGWMIGSAIGGYVDPTVLTGPKLTDPQRQTSSDGVPRPIVYGTAAIMGNVIQVQSVPTEHKHRERSGKGGPVQETFTYTRTTAIRICEAAPLGGEMKLRRAWVNGKLAYDASEGGEIDAESAKFLARMTFYSGSETQLPNADLEALPVEDGGGVGNVPAYRGTCYAVLPDLDVTNGGALPQIRWEVTSEATTTPSSGEYHAKGFADHVCPWDDNAPSQRDPRRSDVTYQYAAVAHLESYNDVGVVWRDSIAAAIADKEAETGDAIGDPELVGWTTQYTGVSQDASQPVAPWEDVTAGTYDWTTRFVLGLVYTRYAAPVNTGQRFVNFPGSPAAYATPQWAVSFYHSGSSTEYARCATMESDDTGPAGYNSTLTNDGGTFVYQGFIIACKPVIACAPDALPAGAVEAPDHPGYYVTSTGEMIEQEVCTPVTGTFKQLSLLDSSLDGAVVSTAALNSAPLGPALSSAHADYSNQTYWDAQYAAAVTAGDLPAGWTYSSTGAGGYGTYPRSTTVACECAPQIQKVLPGTLTLSDVVGDLIERAAVTDYDVSALTDVVRGFAITQPTDAAGAIRALQPVYFFDITEYGNSGDTGTKLRAVKRGGASVLTLTDDALVDVEDDEDARAQAVEFPRKVNLMAPDPAASYEVTKQTAERTSENIKATGEVNISTAVIFTADERAQIADISQKVAWEEQAGRSVVTVPEEYTQYVTSDIITRNQKRFRIDAIRQGDGTSRWELTRDRASAYSSNATAGTILAPPTPTAGVRGPTMFAALNLPSLKSSDNVPGIYVAVCGRLPAWNGADIYLSVDAGVTEQKVATIVDPAIMGTLSADMTTGDVTLAVSLYNDDELDTVTLDQLAARLNACAVTSAGVSEILQFQTATDTGTKAYDLTDLTRPLLGTTEAAHSTGDGFVVLDLSVVFIPIDASHAGETLIFRPVSRGTVPANNPTYSVVFEPPTFIVDGGEIT